MVAICVIGCGLWNHNRAGDSASHQSGRVEAGRDSDPHKAALSGTLPGSVEALERSIDRRLSGVLA